MIKKLARWILRMELAEMEGAHEATRLLLGDATARWERMHDQNKQLVKRMDAMASWRRFLEMMTSPEEVRLITEMGQGRWDEALMMLRHDMPLMPESQLVQTCRRVMREALEGLLLNDHVTFLWRRAKFPDRAGRGDELRATLYIDRAEFHAVSILRDLPPPSGASASAVRGKR